MEVVARAFVIESSPATLRGLIVDADEQPVEAADIATIEVESYSRTTGAKVGDTVTLLGVDCIHEIDSAGLNSSIDLDGSQWPEGGDTYRIQVHVIPVGDGVPFFCLWDCPCEGVYGQ